MCNIVKVVKNNAKYITRKSIRLSFSFFSVASVIEIAITHIIDNQCNIIKAAIIVLGVYIGLFLLCFIIYSLKCIFQKKYTLVTGGSHAVYLHYGDLFKNEITQNKDKYFIVINVNRCFDTIVDDELISSNTLHGSCFKNLYKEKKFTVGSLQDAIYASIPDNVPLEMLTKEDKPKGNLKRFQVGTISKIDTSENQTLFLLGMSSFDKHLNAHTSITDYMLSINELIEYCDRNSQGYPVLMPLLGSGLSRTGIEINDILDYLCVVFKMNKKVLNCDFHIYVKPEYREIIKQKDYEL